MPALENGVRVITEAMFFMEECSLKLDLPIQMETEACGVSPHSTLVGLCRFRNVIGNYLSELRRTLRGALFYCLKNFLR